MEKTQRILRREIITNETIMHLAFELSQNKWKLGFSDGNKMCFKKQNCALFPHAKHTQYMEIVIIHPLF
jgi:hypothetical protein